jgi:HK97 gp10 family phage protein
MAARFDISMLGDKALSDSLAALPENLERKVLQRALRNTGKFYLTLAKARAPKETGKLSAGLKLKPLKRRKGRVGVSIQTPTRAELGIDPQRRGFYPAHQELGTRHLPPDPYLRGTLQTARNALLGVLRAEVDNGIERELTKGK